jgi:hypothetical protein
MKRLDHRGASGLAVGGAGVQFDDGHVETPGRGVGLDRLAPVRRFLDLITGSQKVADTDTRDGMAVHHKTSTIVAQLHRTPSKALEEGSMPSKCEPGSFGLARAYPARLGPKRLPLARSGLFVL